jgi:transcriptional regulator with XRE-family HTH domain
MHDDAVVPSRRSLLGDVQTDVARMRVELGREVRIARLGLGISQTTAGGRVGISHAQFSRIERATIEDLTIDQLIRACAAVGLRLLARAIPGGDPPLDSGQLALLGRLRRQLPQSIRMFTEVPLPNQGDLRAWDATLEAGGERSAVEAEARIRDFQAVERRVALKQRDGGVDRVILLVAATEANRQTLAAHREHLRARFPLDSRAVLGALRSGRLPEQSGILIL